MARTVKTTQTRSVIGHPSKHKVTLLGLGLRRTGHTVEREDIPTIRGTINAVSFMVKVEEQEMRLNTLSPTEGFKKAGKRLGRGIGSGLGKTGDRGHRGQKSRSGGGVCRGFEGGRMLPCRRLSELGFTSRKAAIIAEIRLSDLAKVGGGVVDLNTLKAVNIIGIQIEFTKAILAGEVTTSVTVRGLRVTKGARAAIEVVGGKIEE